MNEAIIEVDGTEYQWVVRNFPKYTSQSWKGLAIEVQPQRHPQRQLVLQFPMEFSSRHSTPHRQRPNICQRRLAEFIREALAAGWDPQSRGKPFVLHADHDDTDSQPTRSMLGV